MNDIRTDFLQQAGSAFLFQLTLCLRIMFRLITGEVTYDYSNRRRF